MLESLQPDPTFHASPRLAMQAEREHIAYTVLLSPDASRPDALAVVDVDPGSRTYGSVIHRLDMPYRGDEFHHFGWNACSSALSPMSAHTVPAPSLSRHPGAALVAHLHRRHRARPAAPDDREGDRARGSDRQDRLFAAAHRALRPRGPLHQHPGRRRRRHRRAARGLHPGLRELRHPRQAGRSIAARRSCTTTSGGTCRATAWCRANGGCRRSSRTASSPRTCSPTATATGCISGTCASAGIRRRSTSARTTRWRWRCGRRTIRRATTASSASSSTPPISKGRSGPGTAKTARSTRRRPRPFPPEPADKSVLPALLKGFGAVPPLISDIDLSLDDRFLYVACWGTGELRQYDVSDPMKPELAGSVRIGGVARHANHPSGKAFGGGPQMVEISRDGKRVYFTNSLYSPGTRSSIPTACPARR